VHIRIGQASSASVTMLLLGTISLVTSISYNSSLLAFIGLGFVFWGAILLYIKPEEYTRRNLLEAAISPSLTTLSQMIQELDYKGDATYLPPKYFTNPETTKICVSKYKHTSLPTSEQIQPYEDQPVARTAQGLLLTPPGIQLSRLLEESYGASFIRTSLENLQRNLPKLFIEDLEIAENLEIQAENDTTQRKDNRLILPIEEKNTIIYAKITKPFYTNTFKEYEDPSQPAGLIGCPIRSAIAIAITKATGKPVRITSIKDSEDGNTMEATYEIIED
jgi:hypothetical protein